MIDRNNDGVVTIEELVDWCSRDEQILKSLETLDTVLWGVHSSGNNFKKFARSFLLSFYAFVVVQESVHHFPLASNGEMEKIDGKASHERKFKDCCEFFLLLPPTLSTSTYHSISLFFPSFFQFYFSFNFPYLYVD